ncbi:helix-turn-helix domain-containing protein [Amycolatopsis anabasis]|uniref:helix-turn-helix domain-containing protein n=1 Tax=Amycolatopsis anabasis TaxID=1840409 RepID=UPI00131A9076|nr:helix-turn-helix transcriptional regulator [Amycolatopsis anabasis]
MVESFGQVLRRLRESADVSQRDLARRVFISQTTLSRYESDRQAVDPSTADRLDEALGADGALRALLDPGSAVLTSDDRGRLARVTERPRAVDSSALGALAAVLAESRRMEDTLGARAVLEPTLGYVRLLESLVVDARGVLRPAVVDLAAQWAQFTGWLHAATDQLPLSGRWFDRALEWATEADNVTLQANALSYKGHLAWMEGHVGPMIGLSRAAQRNPAVHVGQRAFDAMQEARGHAMAGNPDQADRTLDVAEKRIADIPGRTEDAPPWSYYYGSAFWTLQRGMIYRYAGRNQEAAEFLAAGLAELPLDQRDAEWTGDYRHALEVAVTRI